MDDQKQHELDAANLLLKAPDAPALFKMLMEVLALPDRLKVKLADDAAPLNPLLALARRDRNRFDRLIAVIEDKLAALGRDPLAPPNAPKVFDKNEYQRELMAQIRQRTFKAAATENLRRPPSGQLVGHARLDFMKAQHRKWMSRLEAHLAAAKTGKTMTKARRQELSTVFWEQIDRELEAEEAAVYQWIQNARRGLAP